MTARGVAQRTTRRSAAQRPTPNGTRGCPSDPLTAQARRRAGAASTAAQHARQIRACKNRADSVTPAPDRRSHGRAPPHMQEPRGRERRRKQAQTQAQAQAQAPLTSPADASACPVCKNRAGRAREGQAD
ncbi:MAG: hypothetical protein Tsb0020_22860 [Haliangiales bacterium]